MMSRYDPDSADTIRQTTKPCPKCRFIDYDVIEWDVLVLCLTLLLTALQLKRVVAVCIWSVLWHGANSRGAGFVAPNGRKIARIIIGLDNQISADIELYPITRIR